MIAEILKAVAWPFVTLVLGGSLIVILRKKLPAMSDRISGLKFNKDGLEANLVVAAASSQLEATLPENGLSETLANLPKAISPAELAPELAQRLHEVRNLHVTPIIQEQEKLIRADIEKLKIGLSEATEILIRHLAVTQLSLRAEIVYRAIFGSQIALLRTANTSGLGAEHIYWSFTKKPKLNFQHFMAPTPSISTCII